MATINRDLTALHSAMNSATTKTTDWIKTANIALAPRGLKVHILETYRTAQRQEELFAQGRNRKGQIVDRRKVVTFTTDSLHEYRLAVDWCPARVSKTGKVLEVFWDEGLYNEVYRKAPPKNYGLELLDWERPHLQIVGGYATAKKLGIKSNSSDA